MRKFLLLILILFASHSYSQTDTKNSKPVFYLYVDKMPQLNYEGGLKQYLQDSLKWPYNIDAEDEILISFVVSRNGNVINFRIEKGIVELFKEEVLRVVESMPNWTPGEVNSIQVDTKLYLPVLFRVMGKASDTAKINNLPQIFADKMPKFNYEGGLKKYVYSHLKWPMNGQLDVVGTVIVSFVVSKDGTVTDVRVAKKLCSECDEEALRVFETMPPWEPGEIDSKPADVKLYFPVEYRIKSPGSKE
jgi:TonB family protein